MAKRGFSSTTSKFLWTIWRPADVSRALVTNPKYSKYLSVAQLDRIVFDSLGRKRFQAWWEKAGLLSFRVGWLADGGGHTGAGEMVVDTLGWFSDGRRFHISFQYSHNQTSYQCPHFLHPSFFSFFFFQPTSLSNAWTVSLLLSILFNFHPSVHQPDAFTNVRW